MSNIRKVIIQIYIRLFITLIGGNLIDTLHFPYGADYVRAGLLEQLRRIENGETPYKSNINDPSSLITDDPPQQTLWMANIKFANNTRLFQARRITSILFLLLNAFIIRLFSYHRIGT
jgi:hypothetical protein